MKKDRRSTLRQSGISLPELRAIVRRQGFPDLAAVDTPLLSDLVDRSLDVEQGVLCILDGAKALRKAVRDVLGVGTPVQRCTRHKERNVCDHLSERDRPAVKKRLRSPWKRDDHDVAL